MEELSRVQQNGVPSETAVDIANLSKGSQGQKGMILPFEPLSLTFHDVNYYVDMPAVSLEKILAPTLCCDDKNSDILHTMIC